jgi:exodeoxyribonuclease VII large subunit
VISVDENQIKIFEDYLTVSELTVQIKSTLEEEFSEISLIGEISNFKAHSSGHWYFTLKDANAQISAVMWRGMNNYVFFTPQNGMKIIVKGRLTVYPPRGNYQIEVRSMKPAGEGELQAAFERLKRKLFEEGLFDEHHKRAVPEFPGKIGIVTGHEAAALRDLLSVAERRYPLVELIIAPAKVQGEGAAEDIVENIDKLNKIKELDLIIVARGGGSLEDLWAFNEEIVARAIFNSRLPVITGVGHEVDYTIADFVSDLRAPTPTAAMELATPNINEIFAFISDFSYNMTRKILNQISAHGNDVRQILNSYGFRSSLDLIKNKSQYLDNVIYKIENRISNIIFEKRNKITLFDQKVRANDINKIMLKGFTLIKQNNKIVKESSMLDTNNSFAIKFYDKEIEIRK